MTNISTLNREEIIAQHDKNIAQQTLNTVLELLPNVGIQTISMDDFTKLTAEKYEDRIWGLIHAGYRYITNPVTVSCIDSVTMLTFLKDNPNWHNEEPLEPNWLAVKTFLTKNDETINQKELYFSNDVQIYCVVGDPNDMSNICPTDEIFFLLD